MEVRSLTYAELGEALGITAASAKRLAIRRMWTKTQGNDGKARVSVPVERLATAHPRDGDDAGDGPGNDASAVPGGGAGDAPGDDAGTVTGDVVTVVALLQEQVARLHEEVAAAREALDAERIRAAQVEVLQALLDVERGRQVEVREVHEKHMADIKAERDRWAAQADKLIPLAETRTWPPAWWPFARRA